MHSCRLWAALHSLCKYSTSGAASFCMMDGFCCYWYHLIGISPIESYCLHLHAFTFIHLADAFIQSYLQLGNTSSKVFLFCFLGWSQIVTKRWVFSCRLKIVRESAFWIEIGRSFHQPGMVNENVLESDFEPLCDGTTRRRSLADLRLLEGM